ncbi:hypothetical protein IL306_011883 [Fusarium sp. DS 682]|nr:hypothetical protein IL306_011883 [Fusarium sp. DS 682]
MASNNKDNDVPMEHSDLPVRTAENGQQGQVAAPGNTVPSGNNNAGTPVVPPGTPAVPPSGSGGFGAGNSTTVPPGFGGTAGQNGQARVGPGSTFQSAFGFRGGGRGGRGGRGGFSGRGNFAAGPGNFNSGGGGRGDFGFGGGHGRGRGGFNSGGNYNFGYGNNFGRGGFGSGYGYNNPGGGRGNSGSGWSNFGGGQGRGHNNRGRGHTHSSRGGVTKCMKDVPRLKLTRLFDEHGKNAGLTVVNPTSGGGPQSAVNSYLNSGGSLSVITDPKQAEKQARRTFENTGSQRLAMLLEPLTDNSNEVMRRRRLTREIEYTDSPSFGLGRMIKSGEEKKEKKEKPAQVEHLGDTTGVECVLCEKNTHDIGECLDHPSGELKGCVLCHDKRHDIDTCGQIQDLGMTDRVRLMIGDRAGMPPLSTEVPWWDLLLVWLCDESSEGQALPTGFPWSMDFTKDVARRAKGKYVQELQVTFDTSGHDRSVLPVDISTKTVLDVYNKFWAPQGIAWPARLVEMGAGNGPLTAAAPAFTPGAGSHTGVQVPQPGDEGILPDIDYDEEM